MILEFSDGADQQALSRDHLASPARPAYEFTAMQHLTHLSNLSSSSDHVCNQ